ncbi:MAG: hypothetical protein L6R38_001848 [Xanthoria sp. 2 TBL-2021]|nr:MAG: hypothetical protein L6R38_001848 [Xanthoria sp. 2 TBL-2021]
MAPRLIRTFNVFPKEMSRITTSLPLRFRDHTVKPSAGTIYDLLTEKGLVKPKALNPKTYQFPNGFSLRGNDKRQQQLVARVNPTALVYMLNRLRGQDQRVHCFGGKVHDEATMARRLSS